MSINSRIIDGLESRNLKQRELCAAIGIAASALNNWLKLGRSIPSEYIIPISKFIEVNIHWMLTGEGEMSRNAAARPVIDAPSPEESAELRRYFDRLPAFSVAKGGLCPIAG
ncbi:MAG: helix-turn-helix domain containing protein [Clostridiales bacterium]|jgi:transcriptional regulator with XRE-family HTH domain|nr:helix-turn-helix domain containing protein [Clostridiales bacterium]